MGNKQYDIVYPKTWGAGRRKYGFFAECSNILVGIVSFVKNHKRAPISIDYSNPMPLYKSSKNQDVFSLFFSQNRKISIKHDSRESLVSFNDQYQFFNHIKYDFLNPIIRRYFRPSKQVLRWKNNLLRKYKIDQSNTIGVYYRSTDKSSETGIPSYEVMYDKIKEIHSIYPSYKILIQTDSQGFINHVVSKKDLNEYIIIIEENLRSSETGKRVKGLHIRRKPFQNQRDMFKLLATFLILAKCNYFVCNSCNGSWWMMLFRGETKNTSQYLDHSKSRCLPSLIIEEPGWRDFS